MGTLQIGNRTVDRDRAVARVQEYLSAGDRSSYPSYDAYDSVHAQGPLVDADFLAPVLLNVSHLRVRTYAGLKRERDTLQQVLDALPPGLDLRTAGSDDLQRLGDLYSILDDAGVHGAQGTVLAKVLHRKRPAFIPLYDEQVRGVYVGGSPAPVPEPSGYRSWRDFMILFASAVRDDLRRESSFWESVASLAGEPSITPLRALDIVAWWAGDTGRRRGVRKRRTTG